MLAAGVDRSANTRRVLCAAFWQWAGCSGLEGDRVTEWVVRRWARYGHERLYAETPGGTALGYLDVKTGRLHSDDNSNLPMLQKAVSEHLVVRVVS